MKRLWVLILFGLLALPAGASAASFSWVAPTTNTDGTPLSDLAGYNVYKCSLTPCGGSITLLGSTTASVTTFTVPSNGSGYAAVTAKDATGNESVFSNTVPFDALAPAAPSGLKTQ